LAPLSHVDNIIYLTAYNDLMGANWALITVVALNLTFSTVCDICAKYWGITDNPMWLYVGMALNLATVFFYMDAIRLGGLAIVSSMILLITIAISVVIGFFFFHEQIHITQWIGIVAGLCSVVLISGMLVSVH
jgi:drug/metabolite transporter (DMT)-like permease